MITRQLARSRGCMGIELCVRFHRRVSVNEQGPGGGNIARPLIGRGVCSLREGTHRSDSRKAMEKGLAKWSRQTRNSAVNARFENLTTQSKETEGPSSLSLTARILVLPKILSLRFLFRALFSVKSNWALGCTTSDRCSDGRNAGAAQRRQRCWSHGLNR
jgi:hypothetical protein